MINTKKYEGLDVCAFCGQPAPKESFKDANHLDFFNTTGACQQCQDDLDALEDKELVLPEEEETVQ